TVTSSPTGITATGAASPIVVTGLANGTTYTFTVTATNGVGTGSPSAPSNAVTPVAPPGAPSAPIIGTATAGNAQATVSFSPPASNGGSPITGYTVTSSPGGISASGVGSPITVTGLLNGTTYTFTVVAANSVGSGPASAPSNAVTPTAPVPSITLTPGSLTFATRPVSTTSPTQTVTVANLGPGSLVITSITVSGDFAFSSTCGASVPVGGSCTIDVSFTPLASGIRNGLVTISSNANGSPHTVALSGAGQVTSAPVIEVSPTSDAFAAQEVGTQSAPELFAIVNAGNVTLIFSDISVTGQGFTLQPTITGSTYTRCGAAIDPGAVCAVQITFTPPAPGSFPGVLHIAGNATNSPVDVRLSASGVLTTPSRALSVPASLAFADQPVGTRSAGHALTITNNSANVVSLGELSADGDFSVTDTCATIAGHGTCTPLVFFRPLALGPRTGHVTIRTLTEAQPYIVDLNGIGVVNTVPQITLSVARLGFGNTLVGVPVAAQVLVRNVGQVPVVIQGVVASGDFFVAHACGTAIAVGATCTLNVSFFPRMLGGSVGGIEIRTNAFGSPHGVQLSGVGCTIPSFARARSAQPLCGP
ncbi:MAG: choice-of-anchor D domain-containing protein, partial [Usitatibacter sp.]